MPRLKSVKQLYLCLIEFGFLLLLVSDSIEKVFTALSNERTFLHSCTPVSGGALDAALSSNEIPELPKQREFTVFIPQTMTSDYITNQRPLQHTTKGRIRHCIVPLS